MAVAGRGRVWPVSVQQASVCAEYGDGSATRGEVEVDAGQSSGQFVRRIWLEPSVSIHPAVASAMPGTANKTWILCACSHGPQ